MKHGNLRAARATKARRSRVDDYRGKRMFPANCSREVDRVGSNLPKVDFEVDRGEVTIHAR
jgi:hypothetical protein